MQQGGLWLCFVVLCCACMCPVHNHTPATPSMSSQLFIHSHLDSVPKSLRSHSVQVLQVWLECTATMLCKPCVDMRIHILVTIMHTAMPMCTDTTLTHGSATARPPTHVAPPPRWTSLPCSACASCLLFSSTSSLGLGCDFHVSK